MIQPISLEMQRVCRGGHKVKPKLNKVDWLRIFKDLKAPKSPSFEHFLVFVSTEMNVRRCFAGCNHLKRLFPLPFDLPFI